MADWSGVYFTLVLGTSTSFAPLGYAAFSMTMTIGRIFGDLLSLEWKPNLIVRVGGFLSGLGLLAIAFSNNPYITLTGFALVGFGLANIVPLTFGAAGKQPGIPTGRGIAGVATFGYAGMLAGPPFIGFVAEQTSLRVAIFIIALLVSSLVLTAKAVTSYKK